MRGLYNRIVKRVSVQKKSFEQKKYNSNYKMKVTEYLWNTFLFTSAVASLAALTVIAASTFYIRNALEK